MRVNRRTFVQASAVASAAALTHNSVSAQGRLGRGGGGGNAVPESILAMKPLPNPAPGITDDERRARVAKAQRLMIEQGLGAIVLEGGTSMAYFVNVRWGLSE